VIDIDHISTNHEETTMKKTTTKPAAKIANIKRLAALVKTGLKAAGNEEAALAKLHSEFIKPLQNAAGFIDDAHKAAFKAISKAVKVYVTDWYLSAPRVVQGVAYDVDALRAMYATGTGEAYRAADKTIGVKAWRYVNAHVTRKAKPDTGAAGKTAQIAMTRSKAAKGKGKAKAAKPAPELSAPQLLEQLLAALRKLTPQSRIVQATEARNQLAGLVNEARSAIDSIPRKAAKAKPRKAKAATIEAPAAVQ
jgi:hypothetical protein